MARILIVDDSPTEVYKLTSILEKLAQPNSKNPM